VVDLENTNE